jgi:tRNA nucleotidyltransferase (CCA-adding enzyme)
MQFLQNLPLDLDLLPQPVYAVGGAVRDALLGRVRAELDLDLVLPTAAVATAKTIASHYRAGFVLLDAEFQIARVVFPGMTLDLAQQMGDSIEEDLRRRDYTINAIAYDLHNHTIIDPLNGSQDVRERLIQMVSVQNLKDDPLRLLRAYRQAAQLNFTIEGETHRTIQQLAPLITQVSAERVLAELRYLLQTPHSSEWLTAAMADGVLSQWLTAPMTADLRDRLNTIDRVVGQIRATYPPLAALLTAPLRDTIPTSLEGICKLVQLLPPDATLAEAQMLHLTFSTSEIRAVTTVLKYLPPLLQGEMSLEDEYFWFQAVGKIFPALVVLALSQEVAIEKIARPIDRYLDPASQVAHPTPLVNGKDLMKALNIPPSPAIGQLLTEIQLARIAGKVSTPAAAIEFARSRSVALGESLS